MKSFDVKPHTLKLIVHYIRTGSFFCRWRVWPFSPVEARERNIKGRIPGCWRWKKLTRKWSWRKQVSLKRNPVFLDKHFIKFQISTSYTLEPRTKLASRFSQSLGNRNLAQDLSWKIYFTVQKKINYPFHLQNKMARKLLKTMLKLLL